MCLTTVIPPFHQQVSLLYNKASLLSPLSLCSPLSPSSSLPSCHWSVYLSQTLSGLPPHLLTSTVVHMLPINNLFPLFEGLFSLRVLPRTACKRVWLCSTPPFTPSGSSTPPSSSSSTRLTSWLIKSKLQTCRNTSPVSQVSWSSVCLHLGWGCDVVLLATKERKDHIPSILIDLKALCEDLVCECLCWSWGTCVCSWVVVDLIMAGSTASTKGLIFVNQSDTQPQRGGFRHSNKKSQQHWMLTEPSQQPEFTAINNYNCSSLFASVYFHRSVDTIMSETRGLWCYFASANLLWACNNFITSLYAWHKMCHFQKRVCKVISFSNSRF